MVTENVVVVIVTILRRYTNVSGLVSVGTLTKAVASHVASEQYFLSRHNSDKRNHAVSGSIASRHTCISGRAGTLTTSLTHFIHATEFFYVRGRSIQRHILPR